MAETDYFVNDVEKLNRLLRQRDKFIVDQGMWPDFVRQLRVDKIWSSEKENKMNERFTTEELHQKFPNGVPLVAMKLLFPEHSKPLDQEELRYVIDCIATVNDKPKDQPTLKLSDLLLMAIIDCSHTIEAKAIKLEFNRDRPGHNAYNQLHLRLKEALGESD